ncbi:hypothetical protein GCM10022295_53860 [Streptomyces osmaniensis]|uniref:Uncharacterized protein n=1 Tax=Streptomyces osmaniensis TaxID=593134 RepID=A0ABP6XCQ0_9ACTN
MSTSAAAAGAAPAPAIARARRAAPSGFLMWGSPHTRRVTEESPATRTFVMRIVTQEGGADKELITGEFGP